jgi:cob(I)alamin adenosyltransferase
MVVLNKIYTRTGDAGETALGNGTRVAKHSARVTAYGTVDELNATLGLARLHATGETDAALARIQNDLFDLGADLCRPDMEKDAEAEYPVLRMVPAQVDRLEAEIDAMNKHLEPLRSFILPGGSALSAHLHLCRTVSPGRATDGGAVGAGACQRGGRALSQPAERLVLCRRAHGQ